MAKIEIYTTLICPYCNSAKELLTKKGVSYSEIRIEGNPDKMKEAKRRSGGRMTVPQIFINDVHVGGFDELSALDRAGELDRILENDAG
jgi:glutaredoxin 3